ncbi:MAG: ABC transporter ATP-binding protein [Candidatus Hodarchaeales archaeon]
MIQIKSLEAEKLNKSFGGIQAVKNVSLEVPKGKIIGLIGPNGSGKSTYFNLITNILEQDEGLDGKIIFEGKDIRGLRTHKITNLGLIRTFQTTQIFSNLTVIENMLVSAPNQSGENILNVLKDKFIPFIKKAEWKTQELELAEKAMDILSLLNIGHLSHEKGEVLSGGQRKLLSIGRILMSASKLILLDEPIAGVNPTLANTIFEHIDKLKRDSDLTFFIIEHNMDVLMDSTDEIYVMNKGELISHGSPEEVQKDPKVLIAYLGEPED